MDNANQNIWGYHLNWKGYHSHANNVPGWLNPLQKEKSAETGLVIWDHETKTVTCLSGSYLLGLHAEMKSSETWRQTGITVGTPVTRISIDQPDEAPREVLADKIYLDGLQAEEIFQLVENKMETIQEIAAAEDKAIRDVLGRVYRLILSWNNETESETES